MIASDSDLIRAKVKITGLYPELAETSVVIDLQCECLSVFDINGDKIGVDFSIERM
ncbi:hypothetical protein NVP1106O_06 [Vibrio phage 1.106.O._10N.286.51.F7]|nr:hypothetical protein NVP1106O_06 [Vibrio phage 1.106.O._10N.286.51.F7]